MCRAARRRSGVSSFAAPAPPAAARRPHDPPTPHARFRSRPETRSRVAEVALLALALVLPARAAALDVKLWPLVRYARDETTGDLHWTAFGPLIEFRRTAETRDLFIRPLLALHQRRGAGHDDRSDILYPLAATRWQDDYQTFRLLLFTYRTGTRIAPAPKETPPAPEWTSRFTLFPFVSYRSTPE